MTSSHRPHTARIWTSQRLALAVLALFLLALAFSSSCDKPTNNANDATNTTPPSADSAPARAKPPVVANAIPLPDALKNTDLRTIDGKSLKLSDYQGKVVVLDLWATWCPPCRQEIPELVELYKQYQGRGVEVIGLTIEDEASTATAVKNFADQFKINYKIGYAESFFNDLLLQGNGNIPQTFVLTRDGRILKRFVGYSPYVAPSLRQAVDNALAVQS